MHCVICTHIFVALVMGEGNIIAQARILPTKRSVGQAVKSLPFHGKMTGSIPVRSTTFIKSIMGMNISKVQELHFEIIKLSSFNDFDGERVVSDLLKNRNLWKGCILHTSDLLPLRGIPENIWNANSLFIQASGVNDNELFDIAQGWNPCEAYWLTPSETNTQLRTGGNVNPVLCLNWD